MCMHVRVTDKRKANIWFACVLYYNCHMPGVVSIPNFSLFWTYVLNNAPGKKLRQKCIEGLQLQEFTDQSRSCQHQQQKDECF